MIPRILAALNRPAAQASAIDGVIVAVVLLPVVVMVCWATLRLVFWLDRKVGR